MRFPFPTELPRTNGRKPTSAKLALEATGINPSSAMIQPGVTVRYLSSEVLITCHCCCHDLPARAPGRGCTMLWNRVRVYSPRSEHGPGITYGFGWHPHYYCHSQIGNRWCKSLLAEKLPTEKNHSKAKRLPELGGSVGGKRWRSLSDVVKSSTNYLGTKQI
jgi:hypothetical protein